jgi:outer membrane receptor for monomeric catechols
LIAKEMVTGGRPSVARYVHMPQGGVCNVRKHIGAVKWRSPDEMGGHGSLVRVRNGMGQNAPSQKASQSSLNDLTQVSIENLMNIEVTSVSKKEQKLSRVAAAVFVITQEDIQMSGAANIPDQLRMVPGMDVAQINGSTWAIGSRGFNQQFANKLLVMVDGRSCTRRASRASSGTPWICR